MKKVFLKFRKIHRKKEAVAQVFSCEFCEMLTEHLRETASVFQQNHVYLSKSWNPPKYPYFRSSLTDIIALNSMTAIFLHNCESYPAKATKKPSFLICQNKRPPFTGTNAPHFD